MNFEPPFAFIGYVLYDILSPKEAMLVKIKATNDITLQTLYRKS